MRNDEDNDIEAERRLGQALERFNRAAHVKTHIRAPLEEAMFPLLGGTKRISLDSTDLVIPVIFTHIDLLGCLRSGSTDFSGGGRDAVQFMREYFGRVDRRYREVSGLLYSALRHGYVHRCTPNRIELKNGTVVDFTFGYRDQDHLTVIMVPDECNLCIYRLYLNVTLLYGDLLRAIDEYIKDLRTCQVLSDRFWKAFAARRQTKEEVICKHQNYLSESDFEFVKRQIAALNEKLQT